MPPCSTHGFPPAWTRNACATWKPVNSAGLKKKRKKTNDLLHSVLPKGTVGEIKSASNTGPKRYDNVAILICDLVGFTPFCEQNSPERVVDTLQDVFEQFEAAIEETGMEKIKTVGDAVVATSGILTDNHEPV